MTIESTGKNLIFLISQPRSGSTMLQNILENHPKIHTAPEPWLMLPSAYALRSYGYQAEYNSAAEQIARKNFYQILPQKEETYIKAIGKMHSDLYNYALETSTSQYFLDKTPRYYHIIPELYRIFPKAKFIILLRNPLAVLCSIINTWVHNDWLKIYNHKHDLIDAPGLLTQGMKKLKNDCLIVHYEQLISKPEEEIQRICANLEIEFLPEIINYNTTEKKGFGYQDQKNIYQKGKPDVQNTDKWILNLKQPQIWRFANNYLHILGRKTLKEMGYSYEELEGIIEDNYPSFLSLWGTQSLLWRLGEPWENYISKIKKIMIKKGVSGTISYLITKKILRIIK